MAFKKGSSQGEATAENGGKRQELGDHRVPKVAGEHGLREDKSQETVHFSEEQTDCQAKQQQR